MVMVLHKSKKDINLEVRIWIVCTKCVSLLKCYEILVKLLEILSCIGMVLLTKKILMIIIDKLWLIGLIMVLILYMIVVSEFIR
jgi:hypothetical protein